MSIRKYLICRKSQQGRSTYFIYEKIFVYCLYFFWYSSNIL